MYKKRITLTEIKQEAKDLRQLNPSLKHTQALNKVAQKYGYEKFEILKAKFDTETYLEISNGLLSRDVIVKVFNTPTPDIEVTEEMIKATLANLGTKVTIKATPLKNYTKENQQIAIIGGAGSGKTTLLFREHEYLDKKTTLLITPTKKNSLNGHLYPIEKDSYFKSFGKDMPVFKKVTFKTFNDKDIDFSKFEIIIIEEALRLKANNNLLANIKKIVAEKSKAVILTFQEKEAAKELGLALAHKEDLREYEKRRSTPLDLFKVYVGGSGMSYSCFSYF